MWGRSSLALPGALRRKCWGLALLPPSHLPYPFSIPVKAQALNLHRHVCRLCRPKLVLMSACKGEGIHVNTEDGRALSKGRRHAMHGGLGAAARVDADLQPHQALPNVLAIRP